MKEPDVKGPAAEAWQIANPPTQPVATAAVAGWLIHSTHFHPFWRWWSLSVVHLRDVEGVPAAVKDYPEAEYELMILSLDPEADAPDPDHPEGGYPFLMPPDLSHQFHGITDAEAQGLALVAVRAICAGRISPDADYRSIWKGTIAGTIDCIREGGHRPS